MIAPNKSPLVGRREELALLLAGLSCGRRLLIEGPVGVGKTRLAEEAATVLGRGVVRVDGDERFGEDKLAGWFDPPLVLKKGYGPHSFVPGPLYRAMSNGGLLFINELNRMPESVQNLLLPVMDEDRLEVPRLGPLRAAPGFSIVATQNPAEFVGAALLGEALKDRFELLVLDYQSFEEEEEIVAGLTGNLARSLVAKAVFLTRATRTHPRVKRGASPRAAASLALIAARLGGDDEALAKAARLALATRVELKDEPEKNPREAFEEFLDEVFKKKLPAA